MESTAAAAAYLLARPGAEAKLSNYVGGRFIRAAGYMDSVEPATAKTWIQVPVSNDRDADLAVEAAERAFESWSTTSVQYRSQLLNRLADIVEANFEAFVKIESRDQGKPEQLARTVDIPRCLQNLRTFASAIQHFTAPSTIQDEPVRALNYVKFDAIGVAALIAPWNLPLYLMTFKLAPALACGNTCVLKPSEMTSASSWLLAHAAHEAGFPPGVVNLVIGTGAAGEALVTHPSVALISFTGSTIIGKRIGALAAAENKKVSLEMGGKNACIVLGDADLDTAMPTIARSCFANQGEVCLCTSRLLVHQSVYEDVLERLVDEAKKMTVGDPETSVTLGAINSKAHYDKVTTYMERAKKEGGTIHCGGSALKLEGRCSEGYFVPPTVVTGLPDSSGCWRDEIFGPIVIVSPFDDVEDAICRTNDTRYGLSASVWGRDVTKLHGVAHRLRVGTVWINTWMTRDLNMPFGGTKESGTGREGAHDSLLFYTEPKTICLRLAD